MKIILLILTDVLFASAIFFLYMKIHPVENKIIYILMATAFFLITLRGFVFVLMNFIYAKRRIKVIQDIITEFKKGKFSQSYTEIKGDSALNEILKELIIVGKHLDNIVTSQKKEIENFHELYNSIIFSLSSYFIILDDKERVVFANDGFYKKFQFNRDEIFNKKIEEIFYFVNARLRGGIAQVKKTNKTVVLEKTHLLTLKKVSIIADIKISNILIQGRNQVLIVIDDVTKKLRNDYQISLMSQISESIQRDDEIDRVLHTLLTGVTSGTGLGFNRAMLFLVDDQMLTGKMAVGPDSFEEAIEIWSSVSSQGIFTNANNLEMSTGLELLRKVLGKEYSLSSGNIFIQSLNTKSHMHIHDVWNDHRVDDDIRHFMDVREFVIIPLVVVNRSIGIIVADNKFNNAPISNESIELLSIFAYQAAMSIEGYRNLDVVKNEMKKISERQDAIVESEKLAAVGRIAAHLAHEIRNPLVTMGGYARRIIQLSKDKSKDIIKIDKAAEIILKESERLEKTLSNVMDFSRPAKFIMEFNNINEIIQDTLNLLKNLIQEKKLNLAIDLSDDIPLVKSDFNQMKQVMLNLLQNSIDATDGGGKIFIKTMSEEENVVITIGDTGPGINIENPDIIFEPFYSTKVTGVGLGLAIVKKIIKDHNGIITVENNNEGGVIFSISLPVPR